MGKATFAERELIIKKMDAQFEADLKMRKQTSVCQKRAVDATKNLSLLQKVTYVSTILQIKIIFQKNTSF